jgi:regulator of protease activity HflC (stomatin/prohibitin superfamily)
MIPYIKIVRQYERLAVFTLGKFSERSGLKGPGIRFLVWPIQTSTRIDLREEVIDIPRQTNITSDNAPLDIDFLVFLRPMEHQAQKVVLEVINYHQAVIGMATTILRAVVGEMTVDEVLSQRERINDALRVKLDEITGRWGIKVTQVEIKEIEPATDIQSAMNRQMAAERLRRAEVTEAEGTRQASITVAEGEKQAAILRAEGQRQSEILAAEGDQQASVLRAEGFSTALDRIYSVAQNIDTKTLSLQYFETLKEMGKGDSTKFIFPMEFTKLLGPFASALSVLEDKSPSGDKTQVEESD